MYHLTEIQTALIKSISESMPHSHPVCQTPSFPYLKQSLLPTSCRSFTEAHSILKRIPNAQISGLPNLIHALFFSPALITSELIIIYSLYTIICSTALFLSHPTHNENKSSVKNCSHCCISRAWYTEWNKFAEWVLTLVTSKLSIFYILQNTNAFHPPLKKTTENRLLQI